MATASPAAKSLLAQATAKWPLRNKASDGLMPSAAHHKASPTSDHEYGNAVDLTDDPAHGVDCSAIVEAIRKAHDPRVKYVIHDRRIFSSSVVPWMWRAYTGSNPHTKHMHVSILAGRRGDTSPWPGVAQDSAFAPEFVHRFWNPKLHDHFYTASPEEASAVARTPGWRYEGAAWRNDAPGRTIPVWRFRHSKTGQHFYTASRDEYTAVQSAGWVPEGVAFSAGGTTPVRRFYDRLTGEHLYTASPTERPRLWRDEGVAFYV